MKAQHFSNDIQDFLRLLHLHRVRYLIVGGEAVIYYSYARLTEMSTFFMTEPKEIVADSLKH